MWCVENPTIQKTSLDFTSSGQGRCDVSQLTSGGVVLMNALELMEWNKERTQVLVCGSCGIVGCKSGDWVNLRKAGELILMIPAFDEIEADAWSSSEYRPPKYFGKKETPYFDGNDYRSLVRTGLGLPELETITNLKMSEAMRLAQLEMPFRMFGEPPVIELTREKRNLVVAASEGEHQQHLETIEQILRSHYNGQAQVHLRKIEPNEEVILLFLDAAEFIDWKALSKSEAGYHLILDEDWVIVPNLAAL